MSSQAFLWINIGIGLFLVVLFLLGRKNAKPSRLNLRAGIKKRAFAKSSKSVSTEVKRNTPSDFHVRSKYQEPGEESVKNLNVMFMYNGHNFDAYEVLGLPAGAKLEQVKKAYEQAVEKADPSSKDFLEVAFKAIVRDQNS